MDSLADEFRNRHTKGFGLFLDASVVRFSNLIWVRIMLSPVQPIPRSSMLSSGAPQVRQMSAWQSPQSSGSGTGLVQAGQ